MKRIQIVSWSSVPLSWLFMWLLPDHQWSVLAVQIAFVVGFMAGELFGDRE